MVLVVFAACGRPEASSTPEAKSPVVAQEAVVTEAGKSPEVAAPRALPIPEKKSRPQGGDTSASDAYHTDDLAGRAGFPPGSGALVEVPERDRQAMLVAVKRFFEAARVENRDAMRDVSTQLFTTNLIDNLDRYRERFFRGLNPSLESALKGIEAGEVRLPEEGHFEIEVKFADGTNRRMMMAVESGHWRVNRL